ncbi:NUDIX domain-containing protein [Streptomyces platensis]|uniref:NUDIX domain-containing protein n=1 Tax=Streptomyces platensis TaxID=58346 RepID=UPI003870641D
MNDQTSPTDSAPPHQLRPQLPLPGANASALIYNESGAYLLHLRDDIPGIWEPGSWSLLGGGREPGDRSLEETIRRELREEAGLDIPGLVPFTVEEAQSSDGTTLPIQIFAGQWSGDPADLELTEGIMLHWFRPEVLPRLRMSPSTRALLRRHAELLDTGPYDPAPSTTLADPDTTTPGRPPHTPHAEQASAGSTPLPLPPPAKGDTTMHSDIWDTWDTVTRLARRFNAHDDERGLDAAQQWTLQVLKIAEETGEASQAVIGVRGTNPRKGDSHTWQDVHAEVADVVITGLVALARMRPDDAAPYLRQQLAAKAAKFLPPPSPAQVSPLA